MADTDVTDTDMTDTDMTHTDMADTDRLHRARVGGVLRMEGLTGDIRDRDAERARAPARIRGERCQRRRGARRGMRCRRGHRTDRTECCEGSREDAREPTT